MSAAATPLRNPVTWFGGKGHPARRIVALLPPLETLNDLAGDVVHFYRVLRDPAAFERFSRLAALTPYAREEFEDWRRACHDDEDPVARLGLVRQFPASLRGRDRRCGRGGEAHLLAVLATFLIRWQVDEESSQNSATVRSEGSHHP